MDDRWARAADVAGSTRSVDRSTGPQDPPVSDPEGPLTGPRRQRRRRRAGATPATIRRGGDTRKWRTGHHFERRDYRSKEGSTPRRSSLAARAGVDGDVDSVDPCGGRSTGVLGFELSEHQAMRACARWAPGSSRSSPMSSDASLGHGGHGGDGKQRRWVRATTASMIR